jgi:hypothetical protein
MTADELDTLRQLFGAYFHQDWTLDADTPELIVDQFVADSGRTAEELTRLARLSQAFAAASPDEATLERALLTELGCYYAPSAEGATASAWLEHVAGRLSAAAERRRGPTR